MQEDTAGRGAGKRVEGALDTVERHPRETEKPTYRSRVVAIEFNTSQMDGLFAATAPLEALKLFVSDASTVE